MAVELSGPSPGRVSVINLMGTTRERDWLRAVHGRTRLPKTTIVRLALAM